MPPHPPRIPKLTYRNRLPDQSSVSSQSSSAPSGSTDTHGDPPLTPISTAKPARPSSDSRSATTSSSASTSLASSNGSTSKGSKLSASPTTKKKKKKNGVLDFLVLKEPSQVALEQFAESQNRQAAAKGGTAANLPGLQSFSPQKLPANVPKVNSKWDGIPASAKSPRNSMVSKRNSSSSHGSTSVPSHKYSLNASVFSVASDDSQGPPNSLASPTASTTNFGQRRDSGLSESPTFTSPSTSSLPEMTYFFPDNPNPTGTLPSSFAEHPWSPPPPPPRAALEAFSFNDGKPDEPAVTDTDVTLSVNNKAESIFRRLKGDGAFLAGEAHEVKLDDKDEDPDLVPGSHDFLFDVPPPAVEQNARSPPLHLTPTKESLVAIPSRSFPSSPGMVDKGTKSPTTTNFSRPRQTPFSAHKAVAPSLPTLYEASIASTDTVTELPGLTKIESGGSDASMKAPSIAPSVTPSEMSASWYRSSRERLGLGGRIRKNDVLPWESPGEDLPGKRKSRLSVFSKNTI